MPALSNNESTTTKRARKTRKVTMVRINLWVDPYQLESIDQAAKKDYTSRSQLMRTAINWYLWPSNRALETSEDYIFETIKHRRALAASQKLQKEHGHEIDVYDT